MEQILRLEQAVRGLSVADLTDTYESACDEMEDYPRESVRWYGAYAVYLVCTAEIVRRRAIGVAI